MARAAPRALCLSASSWPCTLLGSWCPESAGGRDEGDELVELLGSTLGLFTALSTSLIATTCISSCVPCRVLVVVVRRLLAVRLGGGGGGGGGGDLLGARAADAEQPRAAARAALLGGVVVLLGGALLLFDGGGRAARARVGARRAALDLGEAVALALAERQVHEGGEFVVARSSSLAAEAVVVRGA